MDEINGKHQAGSCGGAGAAFDAMDPDEKVALVRALHWPLSASAGAPSCSTTPGRPVRPLLVEPKNLPRRRALTTVAGRFALLHALAHSACGGDYGDLPAHDGLWEMALDTAADPLVRMALVPRVLEARAP